MADDEARDLHERNRALDEQLKRLVRTEHRLYKSQRELGQQLRRVDAVNRLALDAAKTNEPAAIAGSAFEMLFSLFPYEQGLAVVTDDGGRSYPLAVSAAPGCEHDGEAGLARLGRQDLPDIEVPEAPVIVARTGDAPDELRPLLGLLDRVFASPEAQVAEGSALILPLQTQPDRRRGALVLRRLGRAHSYHEVLPKDGDAPYLMLVARQVAAALGKTELLISLRRSYDELEAAQRELVNQARLAAIGELAAVVAHEVRNPLGAIFNALSALNRVATGRDGNDEPVTQLLGILKEEAHRLERIVSDLIDFSRPAPSSKRDLALAPIAAEALDSAAADAEAREVKLELDADEGLRAVVDEHLLRRALLNLVDNATQATKRGGVVRVRVARDDEGAFVEVADEGHGIPDDDLGRIFEPFYTTRATGTGLGLAVVRRFADSHGGTIDVSSAPERGSVFTIRLEVADTRPQSSGCRALGRGRAS
ncbi:MAG TPA: hypothetical protein ENK57_01835 [Polyangiaceae bacterium]|nr:hypothetical protein [Polyangiaceae bacterium]